MLLQLADNAPGDASSTRRHGGAGLGLALAQRLDARLGGRIACVWDPGHGAPFTVALPTAPA